MNFLLWLLYLLFSWSYIYILFSLVDLRILIPCRQGKNAFWRIFLLWFLPILRILLRAAAFFFLQFSFLYYSSIFYLGAIKLSRIKSYYLHSIQGGQIYPTSYIVECVRIDDAAFWSRLFIFIIYIFSGWKSKSHF